MYSCNSRTPRSCFHGFFFRRSRLLFLYPNTTKILIANPTSETTVINAGCRLGSIIPTHLNSDDSMIVGAVCMDSDQSWLDFPDQCNDDLTNPPPVAPVRLAAPDDNTHTPIWRLHSNEDPNEDISAEQRIRLGDLGDFALCAAIGGPNKPSVFSSVNDLGRASSNWKSQFHHIDTGDIGSYEIRRNPRHYVEVDKMVQERLALNVIEPSSSPWRFPVVLTPKTDGSIRVCVDYRRLNEVIVPYSYRLPRQDGTMDALGDSTIFSVLDLSHGFHQLPLDKTSRSKTAFSTRRGLFQWITVPFGIRNAPPLFSVFSTPFWCASPLNAVFCTSTTSFYIARRLKIILSPSKTYFLPCGLQVLN
jgi:hypothetical protein